MITESLNIDALLWVRHEDLADDVFGFGRQKLRKAVVSVENLLIKLGGLLIFIGQIAAEHGVEDNSTAPYI